MSSLVCAKESVQESGLAVPYACDPKGDVATPEKSRKADGPYKCLQCDAAVVHRVESRNGRRAHFAHAVDSNCRGESVIHLAAKRSLSRARVPIRIRRQCVACARWRVVCVLGATSAVREEVPITATNGDRFVLDAVIDGVERCPRFDSEMKCVGTLDHNVRSVIEVWHTHRTTRAKRATLTAMFGSDRTFEVRAKNVLDTCGTDAMILDDVATKAQACAECPQPHVRTQVLCTGHGRCFSSAGDAFEQGMCAAAPICELKPCASCKAQFPTRLLRDGQCPACVNRVADQEHAEKFGQRMHVCPVCKVILFPTRENGRLRWICGQHYAQFIGSCSRCAARLPRVQWTQPFCSNCSAPQ